MIYTIIEKWDKGYCLIKPIYSNKEIYVLQGSSRFQGVGSSAGFITFGTNICTMSRVHSSQKSTSSDPKQCNQSFRHTITFSTTPVCIRSRRATNLLSPEPILLAFCMGFWSFQPKKFHEKNNEKKSLQ
ncbi:hypothetical protein Glove_390g13 [Diversispora epigaea]|uniref:Uncharacterized protein n=1 Tax=Diversispora epigaea TaxID=1348612 RepID=A0A397H2I4_9GLOM|nr:hypothetical protein Glove_390g13 [Diversispora epigaea]